VKTLFLEKTVRFIHLTSLAFILAVTVNFCHGSDDIEDEMEDLVEDQIKAFEGKEDVGDLEDELEDVLEDRLEAQFEKAEDFDDDLEDRLEDMFEKHHKMDDDFEDDLEDHMEDRLDRMERQFPDDLESMHQLAELDERLDDLEILSIPDEYIELMDEAALVRARESGAEVRSVERLDRLGQLLVTFSEERTDNAEMNHVYTLDSDAANSVKQGVTPQEAARLMGFQGQSQHALRIAMMDSSIDVSHACFDQRKVKQKAFYPDGAKPDYRHGTSMASVFTAECGLLAQADIYNAEVFGRTSKGLVIASAADLIRGLDWLLGMQPDIVSLSLSGPPNKVLSSALDTLLEQGIRVVASVGNEGPAAYPRYPAAHPGVIAITAVDEALNVYSRAVQGKHVRFAAPGVGIRLADADGDFIVKDGTSVAAAMAASALVSEQSLDDLERNAQDLGVPGFDSVFGFGLLNLDVNIVDSGE
jgi:hypothetical protein|tara:strand:- start:4456 stop:5874 length:1419 start_codon:yes stop_codon:yes gene_type:complete